MQDQELDDVKQEKDIGVIINHYLKMSDQCTAACKKVNMIDII